MRTIGLAAILALTSTAAFAGSFQFSIGGGTARVDFDEDCTDRLCASVSWQEHGSRQRTKFRLPEVSTKTISKYIDVSKPHWNSPAPDDDEETAEPPSNAAPKPVSKPSVGARQDDPDDGEPGAQGEPDDAAPTASDAGPADEPAAAPPPKRVTAKKPAPAREPAAASDAGPADEPVAALPPKRVTAKKPAPEPSAESDTVPQNTKVANVVPKSAPEATEKPARPTPVGEWLVEDGEGKIRIEPCGANLCGYVSAAKNPNETDRHNPNPSLRNRPVLGTPILINMKPDGKRWSGRIYNVKDGRSYTAHISLRSTDTLRVEGCAFGGMICGGQNWSRVD